MRKTPLLKAVLSVLTQESKPLSVPDIVERLGAQGKTPNKTTLYRMMDRLVSAGEVSQIPFNGRSNYYELKTHAHAHFLCDACESVQCVQDPRVVSHVQALASALNDQGVHLKDHHLSLMVRCKECV